jgi:DeoR family fructose operon transcriptional repressor
MKQNQRHSYIIEKLDQHNQVEVQDIVDQFNVSPITVRRDLTQLEEEGLLVRTHGGAIKSVPVSVPLFSFNEKAAINQEQKKYICQLASGLIKDGDIIFMDSGSTVFHLCFFLEQFKNIIVITNSLPVAAELIKYGNIRVNLIGGEVDNERKAVFGYLAESMLDNYHANKAFIGCDGISLQKGLTTNDEKEAAISRKTATIADQVYLLCDSSKVERNSYVRFAPLSLIEAMITDHDLSESVIRDYKAQDIKIIN